MNIDYPMSKVEEFLHSLFIILIEYPISNYFDIPYSSVRYSAVQEAPKE